MRTGEAMNIDFLLMMKKNDGHSAGISVQQTNKFYLPIVHPMVPIGNLSTTVDQHLGEPASNRHRDVLRKTWQFLQARRGFVFTYSLLTQKKK